MGRDKYLALIYLRSFYFPEEFSELLWRFCFLSDVSLWELYCLKSPRGLLKVNLKGSPTSVSAVFFTLPLGKENGKDAINTAPPITVATIPKGREIARSPTVTNPSSKSSANAAFVFKRKKHDISRITIFLISTLLDY
jgi:hypothetical protein